MAILAVLKRDPVIIHSSIHSYTLFHRTQITSKKRKENTHVYWKGSIGQKGEWH